MTKQDRIEACKTLMDGITATFGPNPTMRRELPRTNEGMKTRADYLRTTATGIKLNGGRVKPDYE